MQTRSGWKPWAASQARTARGIARTSLARRPKLASERLIPQEWLNLALSEAAAAAVQTLRVGACWKARLGCDAGEGVGRSESVIVVRDETGWGHPLCGTNGSL